MQINVSKNLINKILVTFFLAQLCSCENNDFLHEELRKIKSHNINLPMQKMTCYSEKCIDKNKESDNSLLKYKMIVFTDSSECSSCAIKSLNQWNKLLYMEDKGKVKFYFVFSLIKGNAQEIHYAYRISGLNHPIYVDTCNAFLRANPHIPSNPLFHSFLLDENDSVILVGNPVRNKKIEELFFKILEEKKQNAESDAN